LRFLPRVYSGQREADSTVLEDQDWLPSRVSSDNYNKIKSSYEQL
jgi:hypothetical protein